MCERCSAACANYAINNLSGFRDRNARCVWKLRLEIIAAYGGHCECCGESAPEFLTIDHNGISPERDANGKRIGGKQMYRMLKRLNFPRDGYRLLCWNCNCARQYFGNGICPHKLRTYTGGTQ